MILNPYRFGAVGACDPHWANVSALLHMDHVSSWIDETGKTWTPTGSPVLGNSHPKFGARAGEFWTSSNQYISTPSHADFDFGSGDFTVELWTRPVSSITSPNQNRAYIVRDQIGGTRGWLFFLTDNTTSNKFRFGAFVGSTAHTVTSTTSPSINTWYHIAAVRDGGTIRLFVNGTQEATVAISGSVGAPSEPCVIGTLWGVGASIANQSAIATLDEVRVTKGVARYTSNFTPPSAAFYGVAC